MTETDLGQRMNEDGDSVIDGDADEPLIRLGRGSVLLILVAVFIISGCGIIYELLIGSISSYFLGNSVKQYSLTIGFFLFAMGIGSWLSRMIRQKLLQRFVALEIWLGFFGGMTVPFLYVAYTYTNMYQYFMLIQVMILGTFIGLEIPLLTRLLRAKGTLRVLLSNVFAMDYLGALAAALLFPFLLFPMLGSMYSSLLTGAVNVAVGIVVLQLVSHNLKKEELVSLMLQIGFVCAALFLMASKSDHLLEQWEDALYQGQIVHNEESQYQKIVLTRWHGGTWLYLNEHLQFSSQDEHRYHEALVHPAMSLANNHERVLVIGGGDGLAAREILKYPGVRHVDLVDIDPAMTRLGTRNIFLTDLNNNALSRQQVKVTNEDAFIYLQRPHQKYGVIIIDLPDPREEGLGKLYSVEIYRLCRRHLSPGGLMVCQSTSPFFARKAYWCIGATIRAAGFQVHSYNAYVPSFGLWGFHLGVPVSDETTGRSITKVAFDPRHIELKVKTRFLYKELFQQMFQFDGDTDEVEVEPNTLDRPKLAGYYREGYDNW